MNPSQLAQASLYLLPFAFLALVLAAGYGIRTLRGRIERKREEAMTLALRKEFIKGMNNGFTIWGAHVRALQGLNVHGFAEECRECGRLTGSIIARGEEYWACPECKHRNPAPMADGLRPEPPSTTPASHEA